MKLKFGVVVLPTLGTFPKTENLNDPEEPKAVSVNA